MPASRQGKRILVVRTRLPRDMRTLAPRHENTFVLPQPCLSGFGFRYRGVLIVNTPPLLNAVTSSLQIERMNT